jgi:plastocyanin
MMRTQTISKFRRAALIELIVLFLVAATTVHATTHVITFGGSVGFNYSPKSLNVTVGDIIEWKGDFNMHPLSSMSVPVGAQSFHNGSGTSFSYTVTIAGTYNYRCDAHFSSGMTGSFVANTTGVKNIRNSSQADTFKLEQNFPNPFNLTTAISFNLPFQTHVSIKIYNLMGQEVAMIVNENMAAGSYIKTWNATSIPSGVYFYQLQSVAFTATKKFYLIK